MNEIRINKKCANLNSNVPNKCIDSFVKLLSICKTHNMGQFPKPCQSHNLGQNDESFGVFAPVVCVMSLFCCVILCVLSGFTIISLEKLLCFFVFVMSCGCY